jgi:peptide-methionine (R)-S-oxide reductase
MTLFFSFFLFLFSAKTIHSEAEWKQILGKERYEVMRQKKTERSFLGQYVLHYEEGIYICAGCDHPLFHSKNKYNAMSGWPSFTKPMDSKNVYYLEDWSMGFKRYEVLCRGCDSHLGHVFHDGPLPDQLRYSINSIALKFKESYISE